MSGRKTYVIQCDGARCLASFTSHLDVLSAGTKPVEHLSSVREEAFREGWVHTVVLTRKGGPSPSLDFCPECRRLHEDERAVRRIKREGDSCQS